MGLEHEYVLKDIDQLIRKLELNVKTDGCLENKYFRVFLINHTFRKAINYTFI